MAENRPQLIEFSINTSLMIFKINRVRDIEKEKIDRANIFTLNHILKMKSFFIFEISKHFSKILMCLY